MNKARFNRIGLGAGLVAFCCVFSALAIAAEPARAADLVFPPGSRVGLVPPDGMVASDAFAGFADPDKDAAILINVLPAAAFAEIARTLDTEIFKKQGVQLQKREPIKLGIGKGILLTGKQMVAGTHYRKWLLVAAASDLTALVTVQVPDKDAAYPDRVVRAALATLAERGPIPEAEQLSLLPFAVGDLAGFRVGGVLRGRALLLDDGTAGESSLDAAKPTAGLDPHLFIAAVPGGPAESDDRANFARLSFNEIGGIKDVRITMSEPLRISGQSGYQTMAEAKDARTGTDVMVVQWLRFGSGGFLQMVGVAPADSWTAVLARLRTVRDSVELK